MNGAILTLAVWLLELFLVGIVGAVSDKTLFLIFFNEILIRYRLKRSSYLTASMISLMGPSARRAKGIKNKVALTFQPNCSIHRNPSNIFTAVHKYSSITPRKYMQPWPFAYLGSEGRLEQLINTDSTIVT